MVQCLTCKALGNWGKPGRCPTCRKAKVNAYERMPSRRATKRARYGAEYQAIRAKWVPMVAIGVNCGRCGKLIIPGTPWDLDHLHDGLWPSHASCNRGRHTPVSDG